MTPALNGAVCYYVDEWVYIFGGQDSSNKAINLISKVKKSDATGMEKAGVMQLPRVNPFAFNLDGKIVVMGGSEKPLIEAFDEKTLEPEKGIEKKSAAFFFQLACYTSDLKLENATIG